MLSPGKDDCAVSESKVKVTLNATEQVSRSVSTSAGFFTEPAQKVALDVQGSFEEGSGR
jgi:hypothetical protein